MRREEVERVAGTKWKKIMNRKKNIKYYQLLILKINYYIKY